ncbi:MAG: RcnB family protein, partial [Rhodanobacter sp.]
PVRYGRNHRYYGPAPRYVVRHDRWARGHRYHGPNYVVSNYGYYRLRPPPRGYHWVRADNNYLLVAIATGVILDIALH